MKTIEENNGKEQRALQERDTQGTFHPKMGTIKDRMDLTEKDIKKLEEYTEELYKKVLNDPGNPDNMVTHLDPDILECEVGGFQEALL